MEDCNEFVLFARLQFPFRERIILSLTPMNSVQLSFLFHSQKNSKDWMCDATNFLAIVRLTTPFYSRHTIALASLLRIYGDRKRRDMVVITEKDVAMNSRKTAIRSFPSHRTGVSIKNAGKTSVGRDEDI